MRLHFLVFGSFFFFFFFFNDLGISHFSLCLTCVCIWLLRNPGKKIKEFLFLFFSLIYLLFCFNVRFLQRLFLPTYFIIQFIFTTIYGSHCTFLILFIIHKSHGTISAIFYLYFQYFPQKIFNFNKRILNGSFIYIYIHTLFVSLFYFSSVSFLFSSSAPVNLGVHWVECSRLWIFKKIKKIIFEFTLTIGDWKNQTLEAHSLPSVSRNSSLKFRRITFNYLSALL